MAGGQQQKRGCRELVSGDVAPELIPRPLTGKDVVMGQHGAHAQGCGFEVRRDRLKRLGIALGGLDDVVWQAEGKGAAADRRRCLGGRVQKFP